MSSDALNLVTLKCAADIFTLLNIFDTSNEPSFNDTKDLSNDITDSYQRPFNDTAYNVISSDDIFLEASYEPFVKLGYRCRFPRPYLYSNNVPSKNIEIRTLKIQLQ